MRRVHLAGTEIETSCLGFGCASLGSRVSSEAGAVALRRAFDAGVCWFDVAPAYGGGEAEELLGAFLRQCHGAQVLTKVGLAPPRRTAMLKLAYGLGRPVLGLASGLRRHIRKSSGTRNQSLALTPDLILRSIDSSLLRLGIDRVDVYALHDPDPARVADPEIVAALERVLASGKARCVGVAGSMAACSAGAAPGLPYQVFQTAIVPGRDLADEFSRGAGRPVTFIGHSVFGVDGARDRLTRRLRSDAQARASLHEAGYDSEKIEEAAGQLLLDAALASNPRGVTLVSMFAQAHARANLARADHPLNERSAALAAALLSDARLPAEEFLS